jgi:DNA (cytosine-5)-methyltransferase 1
LIATGAFFAGQGAKAGGIAYSQTHSPTLKASESGTNRAPSVHVGFSVRRITPREAERLQGFPDDYTAITYRGKPAADSPRYKALGNSMAVPVMRWMGEQIRKVEKIK